jgi:hypothetical protein
MPYAKTEAGQLAFKERSALLSSRQRSAFILFDGIKSTQQVIAATAGLGITDLDVGHMVTHGFLKEAAPSTAVVAPSAAMAASSVTQPASLSASASNRTPQERFSQAWPLATQLTATLGLRGFRLNLAVEGAAGYDDLLALFPKIQDAVGVKQCAALEQALKG